MCLLAFSTRFFSFYCKLKIGLHGVILYNLGPYVQSRTI